MDNVNLFTAAPVARRIAGAADVDAEPVLRALRKMMASGIVQASLTPQGSGTAPNLFDEAGVYRAAIAFRLSRLGLSDESVREAAKYFNRFDREICTGDAAAKAVRLMEENSEPVFFHLIMAPDYFRKPANVVFGSFSASQDGGKVYNADAWFTTITIPLRGLVASLVNENEQQSGSQTKPPKVD